MKSNIGKQCLKMLIDIYFLLIFLLQNHKIYVCLLLKSVILMKQFQYMKTRKITLQNILPYLSNYPWMPGEIGEKSLIARFLWWPNAVMMSTLSTIGWEASVLFFTANKLRWTYRLCGYQGGRGYLAVYYTNPQCFMITFSYSLT